MVSGKGCSGPKPHPIWNCRSCTAAGGVLAPYRRMALEAYVKTPLGSAQGAGPPLDVVVGLAAALRIGLFPAGLPADEQMPEPSLRNATLPSGVYPVRGSGALAFVAAGRGRPRRAAGPCSLERGEMFEPDVQHCAVCGLPAPQVVTAPGLGPPDPPGSFPIRTMTFHPACAFGHAEHLLHELKRQAWRLRSPMLFLQGPPHPPTV